VQARPAPAGYDGPSTVVQVVYVSKTVTIQGGYTITDWSASNPISYPTTLDAQGNGRVLFITGDISPTVEGVRITGGDAVGLGGHLPWSGDAGGGMYVISATATISNVWVFDNVTLMGTAMEAEGGGGFFIFAKVALDNSRVFSNAARSAGGLSLHYDTSFLHGNTIMSNTAEYGGGLSLHDSQATLDGNVIAFNNANYGGGLHLKEGSPVLERNIVISNQSVSCGGGVYITKFSYARLVNTVIAGNRSQTLGSGLCVGEYSFPSLLHTTIANNGGGDGIGMGVCVGYHSEVVLTNTILVSHTVGVYVTYDSAARLESTLWHGNSTNWSGSDIAHVNDYAGDPAFVNPDEGNYHIGPGSAAIDNGVDAGVLEDIDGNPRPMGDGYDVGADEFRDPALVVVKRAATDVVQAGEPLTYTISVTNTGNVTLTATITDVLPDHVTPAGTLAWTAEIPAPGVWKETVVVTLALGYSGPLTNTVVVTTEEGATGIYTKVIQAEVMSALAVGQVAWPDPVVTGGQLTYTIHVTNTGNVMLTAAVTDVLPGPVSPAGVLTWAGISLAPGEVWNREVAVFVTFGYHGTLTNIVQVITDEGATGYSEISSDVVKYAVYLPLVRRE
jgi:uncharacterized repeat protein (TIGR01451 family)